jgi:hypothetical protein
VFPVVVAVTFVLLKLVLVVVLVFVLKAGGVLLLTAVI